ncbi:peptidylprolyl isomerase [Fulvivirga sedimenti]|uniref:peptidylprolyl isomerase n=1 Tax=Fulvivirga sedimenti TaxID=2879465 RepID=A0A9X1HXC0_9BACT|nr:peptidylprolyl isomerase [Fulvivirga sedimenti]MCA6078492.1 peptidylprolyl isomerase [Fulvivirga sedimenti]
MIRIFRLSVYAFIILMGCQTVESENTKTTLFADSVELKIREFQDSRNTPAIISYLNNENARYRLQAARALASLQDSSAVEMLEVLLNDQDSSVRKAAAFSLGMTRDTIAVAPILRALKEEQIPVVRRELLEALGRVIDQPRLILLQQQEASSMPEKEGLAWGLYRAGRRNVFDQFSIEIALSLLNPQNSYRTRLGASNFLIRTRDVDNCAFQDQIRGLSAGEKAAAVRMNLVRSLGSCDKPETIEYLKKTALGDQDYRVRVNAVSALERSAALANDASLLVALLNDTQVNVAIQTAEAIDRSDNIQFNAEMQSLATEHPNQRVRGSLLSGLVKTDNEKWLPVVMEKYGAETDPYAKAYLLTAAAAGNNATQFLAEHIFSDEETVVNSAAMNGFIVSGTRQDILATAAVQPVILRALYSNDIVKTFQALTVVNDNYETYESLLDADELNKLVEENEDEFLVYNVQKLLDRLNGIESEEFAYENKQEIDWQGLQQLSENPKAVIHTTKGDIFLDLFPEDAPGSVINFINLARSGYYNGIRFHRVVPNFVIQAGCDRGDGWGGGTYAIRTEISGRQYEAGTVGMASAGKDTESTQWFITHFPTHHLDDDYTVFAKVTDGMEVVHQIEVGDAINSIEIFNSSEL